MKNLVIISPKRTAIPPPINLVESGKPLYGTFDGPIKNINLIDTLKPCGKKTPNFMIKHRYTEWEAFEINLEEIIIVSAIYKMDFLCFVLCVLYDKNSEKVSYWRQFVPPNKIKIAKNLLNNSLSEIKTKKCSLSITNNFNNSESSAKCVARNKKYGNIEYDISATILAPPSVVCIPLKDKHPLYTEKDLFKARGHVTVNGVKYLTDEFSTVIIDDHKGFYPFKAEYDWLTTMGKHTHNGKDNILGFNLTRNQSMNEFDYNENLLWINSDSFILPPVKFDMLTKTCWHIRDEFGMVDITYNIKNEFKTIAHALVIDINYHLPFGILTGNIKDTNGNVYCLDGMIGIAEKRRQRV